jgi:hypothetical protein
VSFLYYLNYKLSQGYVTWDLFFKHIKLG